MNKVPPFQSVLNANSRADKIFQRGPNISEIFGPGCPNISTNYPGDPNISINLRPGSTENGGPLFS